jgi:hypothetical protein
LDKVIKALESLGFIEEYSNGDTRCFRNKYGIWLRLDEGEGKALLTSAVIIAGTLYQKTFDIHWDDDVKDIKETMRKVANDIKTFIGPLLPLDWPDEELWEEPTQKIELSKKTCKCVGISSTKQVYIGPMTGFVTICNYCGEEVC